MRVIAVCIVAAVMSSGCVFNKRALKAPEGNDAAILLASVSMPEPISNIARHAWLAVRVDGTEQWHRIEVGGFGAGPLSADGDVRLHAIWRGAKAAKAIPCLQQHADAAHPHGKYLPWPGPNSNTFVDRLLRKCGLRADLPGTSIGKDYRGLIGVSWTSGGTGFQIETPIAGIRLGLTEGIEIHLFALAFGIDLWPPAIIVPFGPGRIGFDDRR